MVIGDNQMTFNRRNYKLNRDDVIQLYSEYLKETQNNAVDWNLVRAREEILKLDHNELLILQSSVEHWEKLMGDRDLNFRRELCAKLYNLERTNFMAELNLSEGAVSNLFNKFTMPVMPRPFQLSVLLNHPWQLINKTDPDPYSFAESPEYFNEGVSKRIHLEDLADEQPNVRSICEYVIVDAQNLFQEESAAVTGRWVTTYPEFDYFEFHLSYEPLIDKMLRASILYYFPLARYLITTYRPFKPSFKRSVWVIIPKLFQVTDIEGSLIILRLMYINIPLKLQNQKLTRK
ncbi:hypothetical protein AB6A23_03645 [Paenibacillus tarimensis]